MMSSWSNITMCKGVRLRGGEGRDLGDEDALEETSFLKEWRGGG